MEFMAGGGADQSLLVVVRQIVIFTFLLLAVFAACLSRHGSSVHMWLEGSWWLVGTVLAVFLTISGILELLSGSTEGNIFILQIIEQAELIIYLLLAAGASLARTRHGERYKYFRTAFWVATILMVVLWSVSSLLDIMTSERALPGTIITMSATLVTAVLMLADLIVTYWHGVDTSNVTEEDARRQAQEPFLQAHGLGNQRNGKNEKDDRNEEEQGEAYLEVRDEEQHNQGRAQKKNEFPI